MPVLELGLDPPQGEELCIGDEETEVRGQNPFVRCSRTPVIPTSTRTVASKWTSRRRIDTGSALSQISYGRLNCDVGFNPRLLRRRVDALSNLDAVGVALRETEPRKKLIQPEAGEVGECIAEQRASERP